MTTALLIFGLAYLAIITERVHRTIVALLGGTLMIVCGVLTQDEAFRSEEFGVDYNVIFLLVGMMVVINVVGRTGLFEWLAIWCVKQTGARPFATMAMLTVMTAVISAMLDNVTTVLLIAPVTLEVAKRLGVDPVGYLIAEAMASNIGGTATLIGDPPNIMIASKARLGFSDFIIYLTPLVVVVLVALLGVLWVVFGRRLRVRADLRASVLAIDPRSMIKHPRLLQQSLWLLGAMMVAFGFHRQLHVEPATVALFGAGLFLLVGYEVAEKSTRDELRDLMDLEWKTIFFFIGLFILVGALVKVGAIRWGAQQLLVATEGSAVATTFAILWGSAMLSAFVDNIPFVAAMNPLIVDLARAMHPEVSDYTALVHQADIMPFWWALAAGACFGGNGTLIGASANVLVADLARKSGVVITFGRFFWYGFPIMILTILLSHLYLWIRFF
jgi:Na+/H+ antiporter NhaD/arsenite permease-like protein